MPWAALAAVTLVVVLVVGSVTGVSVEGTWAAVWAAENWILFLFILHSAITLAGELYNKYDQLQKRIARLEKEAGIESTEEKRDV